MKYTSACVLAAMTLLAPGAALAETEAEYAMPRPAASVAQPARPRPGAFAPASVKSAARLPGQERDNRAFIRAAAANHRFEAEAARLALNRSSDPRVRALATDLIVQRNATSLELQQLLHVRAMALPMMDNEHRRVLKRLGKLSGRKLDQEFLAHVGLKHQRADLALYERTVARTDDPSLKAWIDRQLPILREQVASAERIGEPAQRMGAGSAARRGVSASGSP